MLIKKAEILGLLYSDGNYREYISNFFEYNLDRTKRYRRQQLKRILEFSNTDWALLRHFQSLLKNTYGYKPNITFSNNNVFRVCITKNLVIGDLLKYLPFSSDKWTVPKFILAGNFSIKAAFLKGFFDGDGSTDLIKEKTPRIRISSTNLRGLKQIKILCDGLNLENNLNGPYKTEGKKDVYEILLKTDSIGRFISFVGSSHSKKRKLFTIIKRILKKKR